MSKKRNKGKRNRHVNKYNDFKQLRSNVIKLHKLEMHNNLIILLSDILKYTKDPIVERLLLDNTNDSISSNINWLNMTLSSDYISYTTKEKVKNDGDEYKRENRKPVLIKKLIRKLYGKTFSNKQIKIFLSKYKKLHSEFKNKQKNISPDDNIVLKLIKLTKNNDIVWYIETESNSYIKYVSYLNITYSKLIRSEFYLMLNDVSSFLSFKLVDDDKKQSRFIRSLQDSDFLSDLFNNIEKVTHK